MSEAVSARTGGRLSPKQFEMLEGLRGAPASVEQLDGRVLRGVVSRGFVEQTEGLARLTRAGRQHVARQADRTHGRSTGPGTKHSEVATEAQFALLWELRSRGGFLPLSDADGRVAAALASRAWALCAEGQLILSAAGRDALQQTQATWADGTTGQHREGRRAVVARLLQQLDSAIPRGAEVAMGTIYAAADDVLFGLWGLQWDLQES